MVEINPNNNQWRKSEIGRCYENKEGWQIGIGLFENAVDRFLEDKVDFAIQAVQDLIRTNYYTAGFKLPYQESKSFMASELVSHAYPGFPCEKYWDIKYWKRDYNALVCENPLEYFIQEIDLNSAKDAWENNVEYTINCSHKFANCEFISNKDIYGEFANITEATWQITSDVAGCIQLNSGTGWSKGIDLGMDSTLSELKEEVQKLRSEKQKATSDRNVLNRIYWNKRCSLTR